VGEARPSWALNGEVERTGEPGRAQGEEVEEGESDGRWKGEERRVGLGALPPPPPAPDPAATSILLNRLLAASKLTVPPPVRCPADHGLELPFFVGVLPPLEIDVFIGVEPNSSASSIRGEGKVEVDWRAGVTRFEEAAEEAPEEFEEREGERSSIGEEEYMFTVGWGRVVVSRESCERKRLREGERGAREREELAMFGRRVRREGVDLQLTTGERRIAQVCYSCRCLQRPGESCTSAGTLPNAGSPSSFARCSPSLVTSPMPFSTRLFLLLLPLSLPFPNRCSHCGLPDLLAAKVERSNTPCRSVHVVRSR
jgi:hypothetical protein